MWFIGVEVEQETSAPPLKKNPGSSPATAFEPARKFCQNSSHPERRNYLCSISGPGVVLRAQLPSCFILYLDCLQGENRKISESKLGKQLTKRSQKCLILSSESTRQDNIHETRLRPPTYGTDMKMP